MIGNISSFYEQVIICNGEPNHLELVITDFKLSWTVLTEQQAPLTVTLKTRQVGINHFYTELLKSIPASNNSSKLSDYVRSFLDLGCWRHVRMRHQEGSQQKHTCWMNEELQPNWTRTAQRHWRDNKTGWCPPRYSHNAVDTSSTSSRDIAMYIVTLWLLTT